MRPLATSTVATCLLLAARCVRTRLRALRSSALLPHPGPGQDLAGGGGWGAQLIMAKHGAE